MQKFHAMYRNKLLLPALLTGIALLAGAFTAGYFLGEEITDADVRSSAHIIGLEFSQAEIDSLLPGLDNFRQNYQNNRNREIPNATAPALVFNPIPVGFEVPGKQDMVLWSDPGKVTLPENREDLAFYTVRQLAELIRTRQISSFELTRFFLDRLKKYDPQLHCVISLTEELALEQARRADEEIARGKYRGLLHGIPYGAKDLLATRRYRTTWGATPFREQSFDYDATVIGKLEEAGAVLVAKLTLGALAWGDVWFGGMTRNPWDTLSGSSGSSAGSAAAVAAGLVPFALGTETLGSIVSPSTVCGATGLRPTFGRVSRHGAMALCWSMDKIGPICRSAEDCAVVLQTIQGTDGKDLSLISAPFNYQASWKKERKIRIGYSKADFERAYPFKEQDQQSLDALREMGYELIPVELPAMPDIGFILDAEAAAAFDELTRSGKDDLLVRQIKRAWPNVFRQARFIPAVEYIQANRLRTELINQMQKIFEQVDLYVHPSWASASLRITNFTGHPCIVIPNGFREGKPTSISFTGQLFDEGRIIAVAQAFQEATGFEDQHPSLK